MGVVYRARRIDTGREAAVKTVRVRRGGTLSGMRREILALARLVHPGVVRILEEGVSDALPWYAMELVDGVTLRQHLTRDIDGSWSETLVLHVPAASARAVLPSRIGEPIPTRTALDPAVLAEGLEVARSLCETLAYVHGEGIVHRDLKPDNVLVRPDGTAVIVDFGLMSLQVTDVSREALEATWVTGGTITYMAPEQARGLVVDARADLYAFGCILYEILTGAPPFTGEPLQVLWSHVEVPPRPPSEIVDGVPQPLDELVLKLLAKEPEARPGHAADVVDALTALGASRSIPSGPRPRSYVYRPTFVGRDEALRTISTHLARALDCAGQLVFVGGESGVGKTRLSLQLGSEAHRRGFAVLAGQALSDGPPLGVFRGLWSAISDACREGSEERRAQILGRGGSVLAAYEPSLRELVWAEPPSDLPADAARLRLFSALTHCLDALATERPILLVLDDLQWADDLSLGFLEHLRRGAIASVRVLLLGIYRSEEVDAQLAGLLPAKGDRHVVLGRLPGSAVPSMARSMLAAEAPAELQSFLVRHGEGNPFFVAEYVRMALFEGLLRREPGGAWRLAVAADDLPLPRSLEDLLARRIATLSKGTRAVLDVAAVVGRDLALPILLGAAAGEIDEPSCLAAVTELLARHVLVDDGAGLAWSHDKLRETASEALPAARRVALHRRVAEALVSLGEAERHLGSLGHHWEIAGDAERARACYGKAARDAAARYAPRTAEPMYRAFLRLSPEISSETIAAREELADRVLGLLGRSVEARDELALAVREARALGDPLREGNALSLLAAMEQRLGHVEESERAQREAIAILRRAGDRAGVGLALGRLALLKMVRGQPDEAIASFDEALEIQRAIGDRNGEGATLRNLAAVHHEQGRVDLARELYERALALHVEQGHRPGEAVTLLNLSILRRQQGRLVEARADNERALAILREVGERRGEGIAIGNLASLHHESGERDEARRLYREAIAIRREVGDARGEAVNRSNLSELDAQTGNRAAARAGQNEVLAIMTRVGDRRWQGVALWRLGTLDLDEGDLAAARERFRGSQEHLAATGDRRAQASLAIDRARLERIEGDLDACGALLDGAAEALWALGDPLELARALAERIHLERALSRDPAPLVARARELLDGLPLGPESAVRRTVEEACPWGGGLSPATPEIAKTWEGTGPRPTKSGVGDQGAAVVRKGRQRRPPTKT